MKYCSLSNYPTYFNICNPYLLDQTDLIKHVKFYHVIVSSFTKNYFNIYLWCIIQKWGWIVPFYMLRCVGLFCLFRDICRISAGKCIFDRNETFIYLFPAFVLPFFLCFSGLCVFDISFLHLFIFFLCLSLPPSLYVFFEIWKFLVICEV